jgi:thiamine biosynthesis protein ThiC
MAINSELLQRFRDKSAVYPKTFASNVDINTSHGTSDVETELNSLSQSTSSRLNTVEKELSEIDSIPHIVSNKNTFNSVGTVPIYSGNRVITDSGFTIGKSVPSNAVFTDTTYDLATYTENGLMSSKQVAAIEENTNNIASNSKNIEGNSSKIADLQASLNDITEISNEEILSITI